MGLACDSGWYMSKANPSAKCSSQHRKASSPGLQPEEAQKNCGAGPLDDISAFAWPQIGPASRDSQISHSDHKVRDIFPGHHQNRCHTSNQTHNQRMIEGGKKIICKLIGTEGQSTPGHIVAA